MVLYNVRLSKILQMFEHFVETDLQSVIVHSFDVGKLSAAIAKRLYLNETLAYFGGFLHDIGLVIYSRLVSKDSCFEEDYVVKEVSGRKSFDMGSLVGAIDSDNTHAVVSYAIAKSLDIFTNDILNGILYHHYIPKDLDKRSRTWASIFYISDMISQVFRTNVESGVDKAFALTFQAVRNADVNDIEVRNAALDVVSSLYDMTMIFNTKSHTDYFLGEDILLDFDKMLEIFKMIVMLVDFRSSFTRRHSISIAELSFDMGMEMLKTPPDAQALYAAGLIHDMGKIRTPLPILHKKGPLSDWEMYVMKMHVTETQRILKNLDEINEIIQVAILHHERLDGSGYPNGLKADRLPIKARILQVADVFIALTEDRPYRKGMSYEKALKIIENMVFYKKLDGDVYETLKTMVKNGYKLEYEKSMLDAFFNVEDISKIVSSLSSMEVEK